MDVVGINFKIFGNIEGRVFIVTSYEANFHIDFLEVFNYKFSLRLSEVSLLKRYNELWNSINSKNDYCLAFFFEIIDVFKKFGIVISFFISFDNVLAMH